MPSTRRVLPIEPLGAEAFRPFGDVIEASDAARHFPINHGNAVRYHDLARVDVASNGGYPMLSIFSAKPCSLPLRLLLMERHPLGSQAFMPLSARPFLVVVAAAGPAPNADQLRCFRTAPGQGVNYAPGTWHHPLLALQAPSDFLVVDRGGAAGDANCDEHLLGATPCWIG